jgi:hypothetical protein
MKLNLNIDEFRCPITSLIFSCPVIADDGIVYERDAIEEWLSKKKTSPITNKNISPKLVPCRLISNQIDELIKTYPKLKKDQYTVSVEKIMKSKDYNKLLTYTNIDLKEIFDSDSSDKLFTDGSPTVLKHIIDNATNLEYTDKDNDDRRLIHQICENSTEEVIKYIIDKGVELECQDDRGRRPIHYICERPMPEMIKYIIGKGVNLECRDNIGWRPIHCVCESSTPEMIRYMIDQGVDISCHTDKRYDHGSSDTKFPIELIRENNNISTEEKNELIKSMIKRKRRKV